MILRDGHDITFPILLSLGFPDGVVTWTIRNDAGVISSGTATPPVGSVSINLRVPGSANTLTPGVLYDYRDVSWTYEVGGAIQSGEARYTIEARLPLGISADGVRAKLGVSKVDLPDEDLSLVSAYLVFAASVSPAVIDDVLDGGLINLRVKDAVEATAALMVLPSMPVRVASSEDSGTNAFKRQTIDWEAVGAALTDTVNAGVVAVLPTYDPTVGYGDLFILASPATDAITGE